jgi:hypothetical protein
MELKSQTCGSHQGSTIKMDGILKTRRVNLLKPTNLSITDASSMCNAQIHAALTGLIPTTEDALHQWTKTRTLLLLDQSHSLHYALILKKVQEVKKPLQKMLVMILPRVLLLKPPKQLHHSTTAKLLMPRPMLNMTK